jgi:general secretion pathway protein C
MFAPPPSDPRWSVAVIRDDEAATAGPYGVGARLGDATIAAIEDVRVVLDVGRGRREFLDLLRRQARAPSDGRLAPPDAFGDGVRKTGAHSYEIRRAALAQFLAGGMTPRWPRVVPETRDGEPVGFRLSGVDRDGPFAAIGLGNGDLLLEVNGRSIATPDAALAAFSTLRTASHVWLVIEHDGRRIRVDYSIR